MIKCVIIISPNCVHVSISFHANSNIGTCTCICKGLNGILGDKQFNMKVHTFLGVKVCVSKYLRFVDVSIANEFGL